MASVNKVILVGHVGKDPELRSFQSGGRVASFSLATSESWKDKTSGERKEKTEWHRVAVTNENLVAIVEKYVRKGSKLYLEGQLETRKWTDKDGNEKYSTEIMLKPYRGEIVLLDSKGDSVAAETAPVQQRATAVDMISDEIPFVWLFMIGLGLAMQGLGGIAVA